MVEEEEERKKEGGGGGEREESCRPLDRAMFGDFDSREIIVGR